MVTRHTCQWSDLTLSLAPVMHRHTTMGTGFTDHWGETLAGESERERGISQSQATCPLQLLWPVSWGTNESVELEQLAPKYILFCKVVKLEIESPIIKWHTLATKSSHQNKLTISISACYLLLEVYNEYPRGWILSISSDYLHLRQRW